MKGEQMPENLENAVSPYDTSAEQGELDALNAELEQNRANIEANFSEYFAQNCPAELDELYFEDKKAFADKFQEMQNVFYDENIGTKAARADELNASISEKQQMSLVDEALQAFQQQHPDVNTDELFRFFSEDLPPKKVNELQNLPPEQFFEALYALYQGQGEQNGDKKEKLPKQLNGVPSNDTKTGAASELPMQRL